VGGAATAASVTALKSVMGKPFSANRFFSALPLIVCTLSHFSKVLKRRGLLVPPTSPLFTPWKGWRSTLLPSLPLGSCSLGAMIVVYPLEDGQLLRSWARIFAVLLHTAAASRQG